jgi:hypothetical protein
LSVTLPHILLTAQNTNILLQNSHSLSSKKSSFGTTSHVGHTLVNHIAFQNHSQKSQPFVYSNAHIHTELITLLYTVNHHATFTNLYNLANLVAVNSKVTQAVNSASATLIIIDATSIINSQGFFS